jgi:hypothetical protein
MADHTGRLWWRLGSESNGRTKLLDSLKFVVLNRRRYPVWYPVGATAFNAISMEAPRPMPSGAARTECQVRRRLHAWSPKCFSAVAGVELPNKMVLMLHCRIHQ